MISKGFIPNGTGGTKHKIEGLIKSRALNI